MRKLYGFLILLLASCYDDGGNQKIKEQSIGILSDTNSAIKVEEVISSEKDFVSFYRFFSNALLSRNDADLMQCIHPDNGIHLITSFSGAMPQLQVFKNAAHFDHNENTRLAFERLDSTVALMPEFEVLPKVICEDNSYDKQGCFADSTSNNIEQHPWNSNGTFSLLIETVSITVINTYNFTFYFSFIEGSWYVTFIDIRTPCSA